MIAPPSVVRVPGDACETRMLLHTGFCIQNSIRINLLRWGGNWPPERTTAAPRGRLAPRGHPFRHPCRPGIASRPPHHLAYENLYADAAVGNPFGGHLSAEPSAPRARWRNG